VVTRQSWLLYWTSLALRRLRELPGTDNSDGSRAGENCGGHAASGFHQSLIYLLQRSLWWSVRQGGRAGVPLGSPKDNQDYVLDIQVVPSGDQAEVIVDLDGKPHFRWQGPQSALGVDTQYKMAKMADPTCPAVGANDTSVLFKAVKLRMISGTATLLRTAADVPPPAPATPPTPAKTPKPTPPSPTPPKRP